jgi:hypothetical protein
VIAEIQWHLGFWFALCLAAFFAEPFAQVVCFQWGIAFFAAHQAGAKIPELPGILFLPYTATMGLSIRALPAPHLWLPGVSFRRGDLEQPY